MTDDMVTCMTCRNRQRGQGGLMACMQPRKAGLTIAPRETYLTLGRDLAELPQRCPAHVLRVEVKQ